VDAHAIATNMSLMAQLVVDWLNETFAQAGQHAFPSTGIVA
jgi:hypothetical protein